MEGGRPLPSYQVAFCGFLYHSGLFYTTPLFAELTAHFIRLAHCFITCEEILFIFFVPPHMLQLSSREGLLKEQCERATGAARCVPQCLSAYLIVSTQP